MFGATMTCQAWRGQCGGSGMCAHCRSSVRQRASRPRHSTLCSEASTCIKQAKSWCTARSAGARGYITSPPPHPSSSIIVITMEHQRHTRAEGHTNLRRMR